MLARNTNPVEKNRSMYRNVQDSPIQYRGCFDASIPRLQPLPKDNYVTSLGPQSYDGCVGVHNYHSLANLDFPDTKSAFVSRIERFPDLNRDARPIYDSDSPLTKKNKTPAHESVFKSKAKRPYQLGSEEDKRSEAYSLERDSKKFWQETEAHSWNNISRLSPTPTSVCAVDVYDLAEACPIRRYVPMGTASTASLKMTASLKSTHSSSLATLSLKRPQTASRLGVKKEYVKPLNLSGLDLSKIEDLPEAINDEIAYERKVQNRRSNDGYSGNFSSLGVGETMGRQTTLNPSASMGAANTMNHMLVSNFNNTFDSTGGNGDFANGLSSPNVSLRTFSPARNQGGFQGFQSMAISPMGGAIGMGMASPISRMDMSPVGRENGGLFFGQEGDRSFRSGDNGNGSGLGADGVRRVRVKPGYGALILRHNRLKSLEGLDTALRSSTFQNARDLSERMMWIDASFNSLTTVDAVLGSFPLLRNIDLTQNRISRLSHLSCLAALKQLRVLSLTGNPVCDVREYRKAVIAMLPQLNKLDSVVITRKERDRAIHHSKVKRQLRKINGGSKKKLQG